MCIRDSAYAGHTLARDRAKRYVFTDDIPRDHLSLAGEWTVEKERARAGRDARMRLHFFARDVHLVLHGSGTVRVLLDGKPVRVTRVREPDLYTLLRLPKPAEGVLELRFSRGVSAYAFTFG